MSENHQEPRWASMDGQHPQGVPVVKTEKYWLYGEEREDGWHIIGVRRCVDDGLEEVSIPRMVDGRPVMGLHMSWTCDPEFPDYVNILNVPDCIPGIDSASLRYVDAVNVIPTENPCYQVDGDLLLSLDGTKVVATLRRSMEFVLFPEGVEVIGENAFYERGIGWLRLPEGLREIGASAFYDARVDGVALPDGVKRIGSYAFAGASALSIILPEGLEEMGAGALSSTDLMEVTIPPRLRTIPENAFMYCRSLHLVNFPEGLEEIGKGAFMMCEKLRRVTLPSTLKRIGKSAFGGCDALRSITLPTGIEHVAESAFQSCKSLKAVCRADMSADEPGYGLCLSQDGTRLLCCPAGLEGEVIVPQGVTEIAESAFSGAEMVTRVVLPEGVRSLGEQVFAFCSALEEISLPQSLESIGDECFIWCTGLREIVIPRGVKTLGQKIFYSCRTSGPDQRIQIRLSPDNPYFRQVDGALYSGDMTRMVCLSGDCSEEVVIPDTVCSIDAEVFRYADQLRRIVLPKGVKELPDDMFWGCPALEEIIIPDSVEKIAPHCFGSCSALRELRLPAGITELDRNIVRGCRNLELLRLPENVTDVNLRLSQWNCLKIIELPMRGEVTVEIENMNMDSLPVMRVYRDTPVHRKLLRHNADPDAAWQAVIEVMD